MDFGLELTLPDFQTHESNFVLGMLPIPLGDPNLQDHIIKRIVPSSLVPQYLALTFTSAWAPPVNTHPSIMSCQRKPLLRKIWKLFPHTRHILISEVTPHTSAVSLKCQQWAVCISSLWEGPRVPIPIPFTVSRHQWHVNHIISEKDHPAVYVHFRLIIHRVPCFRCSGISEQWKYELLSFP